MSNDTNAVSVIVGIFWEGFGHLCWPVRHFEQFQVLHQHGEYLFNCINCISLIPKLVQLFVGLVFA